MTASMRKWERPKLERCKCGRDPDGWHMDNGRLAVVVCEHCQIATDMVRADDPVNATTMAAARRRASDLWSQLMRSLDP